MEVRFEDTEAYEFEYSVIIRAVMCSALVLGGIAFCIVCHFKHEQLEHGNRGEAQSVIGKDVREPLL